MKRAMVLGTIQLYITSARTLNGPCNRMSATNDNAVLRLTSLPWFRVPSLLAYTLVRPIERRRTLAHAPAHLNLAPSLAHEHIQLIHNNYDNNYVYDTYSYSWYRKSACNQCKSVTDAHHLLPITSELGTRVPQAQHHKFSTTHRALDETRSEAKFSLDLGERGLGIAIFLCSDTIDQTRVSTSWKVRTTE